MGFCFFIFRPFYNITSLVLSSQACNNIDTFQNIINYHPIFLGRMHSLRSLSFHLRITTVRHWRFLLCDRRLSDGGHPLDYCSTCHAEEISGTVQSCGCYLPYTTCHGRPHGLPRFVSRRQGGGFLISYTFLFILSVIGYFLTQRFGWVI